MSYQPHVPRRDAERVCEVCVGRGGREEGKEEEQREMKRVLEEREKKKGENGREKDRMRRREGKGGTFLFKPSLCCSMLLRTNLKGKRTTIRK